MTAQEMIKKGYNYFCMGCNTAYKTKPQETLDSGSCEYDIDMCRCGCDLFMTFKEYIKMQKEKK